MLAQRDSLNKPKLSVEEVVTSMGLDVDFYNVAPGPHTLSQLEGIAELAIELVETADVSVITNLGVQMARWGITEEASSTLADSITIFNGTFEPKIWMKLEDV